MAAIALSSGAADDVVVQKLLGHNSAATIGVHPDEVREELTMAVLRNPVTSDL